MLTSVETYILPFVRSVYFNNRSFVLDLLCFSQSLKIVDLMWYMIYDMIWQLYFLSIKTIPLVFGCFPSHFTLSLIDWFEKTRKYFTETFISFWLSKIGIGNLFIDITCKWNLGKDIDSSAKPNKEVCSCEGIGLVTWYWSGQGLKKCKWQFHQSIKKVLIKNWNNSALRKFSDLRKWWF